MQFQANARVTTLPYVSNNTCFYVNQMLKLLKNYAFERVLKLDEVKHLSAKDRMDKAYFELLESARYSKINVTDIIKKAGVSRTTFYRHYIDIFDMHTKIADRFALSIIEQCASLVIQSRGKQDYFEDILKIFNSQERYILLISGDNGSRYFFEALIRKAQEFISSVSPALTEEMIFRLRFMAVAMVGVYVRDILTGRNHNPNYIEICKEMINNIDASGGRYANKC